VKVHHLNLCTMCPFGGRLIDGGDHGVLAAAEMVVHALLVETNDGLVLVDTGLGLDDLLEPRRRLGLPFLLGVRPELREEHTAARQVERLGYARRDVRHVVCTHLDVDHAGGIPDFPDATIHVYRTEHEAFTQRRTHNERQRYRTVHLEGAPRLELHETGGDRWFGFDSVRAVADDVLLVPLAGHTRGHCAVAVRAPEGSDVEWLMHCGDAYFFHEEISAAPWCPTVLDVFQRGIAIDHAARLANVARLRDLRRDQPTRVRMFSAHSAHELRAITSADAAKVTTARR
jgi:glyoxylase-like metal-dependent hydrolase (beta-lactamase superfamily II)